MQSIQYTAGTALVILILLLSWLTVTRYRWKCVDISILAKPAHGYHYKVTGVTSNGFDFCIHAAIVTNFNFPDKLAVKYLRAWAMWGIIRIETIVDTRTNVIIYFKDLG